MKAMKPCLISFLLALLMATMLIPASLADENNVVTLNVTNTPIRGDVALEKNGLLLTEFRTETDTWGNTVSTPVYENGYLAGAVFELRAAEDVTGKDGTVHYRAGDLVETLTTSGTGSVKSGLLPLGHRAGSVFRQLQPDEQAHRQGLQPGELLLAALAPLLPR